MLVELGFTSAVIYYSIVLLFVRIELEFQKTTTLFTYFLTYHTAWQYLFTILYLFGVFVHIIALFENKMSQSTVGDEQKHDKKKVRIRNTKIGAIGRCCPVINCASIDHSLKN